MAVCKADAGGAVGQEALIGSYRLTALSIEQWYGPEGDRQSYRQDAGWRNSSKPNPFDRHE
jgi:hypothetical protein